MSNDKRSEFKELERAAKQLLTTQAKKDEERAAAQLMLQALLNILTDCKLRGVMPPFGLLEMAHHLAGQFPGLDGLLATIIKVEHEIVQAISEKTNLSPAYLRDFEKYLVQDPYKAAQAYFEDKRIVKLDKTIDLIEQGKLVPIPEFVQYMKTLEEEKDRRDRLAPALAIQLKMNELQGEVDSPKITQTKEWLGKLGNHKIHAAVCKKHKDHRIERELPHDDETIAKEDQHLIVQDVMELKEVLVQAKVSLQDVAITFEEAIEAFAKTKNIARLIEEIVVQKEVIATAAIEKREEVAEIAAAREAVAIEQKVVEKAVVVEQVVEQVEVATAGDNVDDKAQREAANQVAADKEARRLEREAKKIAKAGAPKDPKDLRNALSEHPAVPSEFPPPPPHQTQVLEK